MENNEENVSSQEPAIEEKGSTPVKTANIKLISLFPICIVIILILFFMFFTRSAKSTVKDYIKAFNKASSDKVMSLMDFEGAQVFSETRNKLENFDSTYNDTMKSLKELDKDQKKDYEKVKDGTKDTIQASLDILKNAKVKYSVSNIKTEKVSESKKLTKVTCTIKITHEDEEMEREVTFYTMKKGLKQYIVSSSL